MAKRKGGKRGSNRHGARRQQEESTAKAESPVEASERRSSEKPAEPSPAPEPVVEIPPVPQVEADRAPGQPSSNPRSPGQRARKSAGVEANGSHPRPSLQAKRTARSIDKTTANDPAWWKRFRDLAAADRARWSKARGDSGCSSTSEVLKSLAAVYSLLASLDSLDPELASVVAEQVRRQVREANNMVEPGEDAWSTSLRRIELPLALTLVEGDEERSSAARAEVGAVWSRLIDECLDGDGMPHGDLVPEMRDILSTWARSEALATLGGESLLSPERKIQCRRLLVHTIDWSRPDGGQRLAPSSPTEEGEEAFARFDLARRVFGGEEAERKFASLATLAKPPAPRAVVKPAANGADAPAKKGAKVPPKSPATKARETLATSAYSEWSKAALLTANVDDREPPCLAATFSRSQMRVGLSANGVTWLVGEPSATLRIDGQAITLDQPWDEVCWHDDEEAVYLEIETDAGSGWRVQRQMLIGRKNRFFYVADVVLGPVDGEPREIEWTCRWPLAPGVDATRAERTREATLLAGPARCLVLPLAEPEWRAAASEGELSADESSLTIARRRHGRALYAPLWFDLDPERSKRPCTWRQLTVAQTMEVVPRDMAVGYRAQMGDDQFLIYRSLGPRGNRTVLGKNLVEECLVARFLKTGKYESVLEIE